MDYLKSATPLSARGAFIVLSVLMFFFSAQVSLTIYIDSSYLMESIGKSASFAKMQLWDEPEHVVGTLYTFASLITLLGLSFAPKILRKYGNYRWTLSILILHVLLLLGLALFDTAWLIIPVFIIETAVVSILYFNFDVFLERYSKNENTGTIRGLFLVIGSIAWLLPPFFAGKIIEQFGGFSQVYLLGAFIMLPTLFFVVRYLHHFTDLSYDDTPFFFTKLESVRHPNVGRILNANFFLHFFYAWMIIYAPLYFHNNLGFSYEEFGMILSFALAAFVIFPYPAGWLADKLIGEKELLIGGFLLMGVTSALIPLLASFEVTLVVWAALLFVGRAGASTVEAMSETYFFKQIDGQNAGLMGYFRRSRPLAFIVAPIAASVMLEFSIVKIEGLFYVLSVVMVFASMYMFRLVDTK